MARLRSNRTRSVPSSGSGVDPAPFVGAIIGYWRRKDADTAGEYVSQRYRIDRLRRILTPLEQRDLEPRSYVVIDPRGRSGARRGMD